jgi:protoporphyrin/coproporphyrin ferrochelatase
MAYGTPDHLDELPDYLQDVRGGRPTPPHLVAEIRARYARIGGKSPLTALTREQVRLLGEELRRRGCDWPVYLGMRHWKPWIRDTVKLAVADGATELRGLVLAPHYSMLSIGKYGERLQAALTDMPTPPSVHLVKSWWRQPAMLAAQGEVLQAALAALPEATRSQTLVAFTAHSLPTRIRAMNDPYEAELCGNAEALAPLLGGLPWVQVWQSAGASPEPWLGPQLSEALPDYAKQGYRHILVAPIGFLCDHVEVLYDLDVEATEAAHKLGLGLSRTAMLNTHPGLISAMADAVLAQPE